MSQQSLNLQVDSLSDLPSTTTKLLIFAGKERIFLFYGDMGAGKTTFVKSICAALGVEEAVSSPTFAIINEYKGKPGSIFHFDFYRLKNQSEALDMGYEEYFYSGNYCFIEWPEKIPDLLPDHYVKVSIRAVSDTAREIIAEHF